MLTRSLSRTLPLLQGGRTCPFSGPPQHVMLEPTKRRTRSYHSPTKNPTIPLKNGPRTGMDIAPQTYQMAKTRMRRCSMSLALGEMTNKNHNEICHLEGITSCGEDEETSEPLGITDGTVTGIPTVETSLGVPQHPKHRTIIGPTGFKELQAGTQQTLGH